MPRTIRAVTTRVLIVVALASPAACTVGDEGPEHTQEFVRAVRAEGLADGYGNGQVRRLFKNLCINGSRFHGIERKYPQLSLNDFPRLETLAMEMCF
jgi:hypothetical protein